MSVVIYEASVYEREVTYRNFKGVENTVNLCFALDPLALMGLIVSFEPRKIKSGNPAINGKTAEISDEQQLKFIRDLACRAAGEPSDDGEIWTPFEDFSESLAGKAFLTKLAASDGDRKEFAEKVILSPFRAFVMFAEADPSNTPQDVQQFKIMLTQMENIFRVPDHQEETIEQKRARLAAEMASIDANTTPHSVPPAE